MELKVSMPRSICERLAYVNTCLWITVSYQKELLGGIFSALLLAIFGMKITKETKHKFVFETKDKCSYGPLVVIADTELDARVKLVGHLVEMIEQVDLATFSREARAGIEAGLMKLLDIIAVANKKEIAAHKDSGAPPLKAMEG